MAKPGDHMAGGTAGRGCLLASHTDREQVVDTLEAAFVERRLTKDEFYLRVGQTLVSRTYAELAAVTADIPGTLISAPLPPKRAQAQPRAAGDTGGQVARMHVHGNHSCGEHVGGRCLRPRRGTDNGAVPHGYGSHHRRYRGLARSRDADARTTATEAFQRAATAAVILPRGRAGIAAPGIGRPSRTVPAGRSPSAAHRRSGQKQSWCWSASSGSRPPRQWRSASPSAVGWAIA